MTTPPDAPPSEGSSVDEAPSQAMDAPELANGKPQAAVPWPAVLASAVVWVLLVLLCWWLT